jgi:superfamily II DNA or RNA helicase
MSKNHSLTFKTYDRMIPSQDTMPQGGFGNLIALPLQKTPRKQGNSVFIDENNEPYTDQWNFIAGIKKHTQTELEAFIKQLSPTSELGILYRDSEDEKPWERKKKWHKLSKLEFPATVKVVRANMIYIDKTGISSSALNAIKRLAAFRNPDFYKAQAMRLPTHEKPRIIDCSEETGQYICLPRGLDVQVIELLNNVGVEIKISDETSEGRKIDVAFSGELRDEQKNAIDMLLMNNTGILSAATAFGKTVVGACLIAERKVNTLILVHRTSLLTQWIEQLNKFLDINEEPIVELTPKGRKRKKSIIGRIGGGKTNASGIIDVAVMQSLISSDEAKNIVKDYGMIIVDECHHVAAFTFEKILKAATARYVYGLTATPTRQDGHHPIINMQCGEIRYRTDAKEHAEARPFEHYLIPRFTKFRKPANRSEKWRIDEVYTDIQNSDIRNNLIVEDVLAAVEEGRSSIVLTERKDHVNYLVSKLKLHISNTIALMSSDSQKKNRETLQYVADIPDDEPFILVATGKYIGEGFDMPRLDTLFLTMPISWKGTVQQYAGRLHRLFDGKEEVQIYDYVDIHVAMLERMYQKRLKGYASIGYKIKGVPQQYDAPDSIFNNQTFLPVYIADIQVANNEILIVSPFIAKRRVQSSLNYLRPVYAKVTVITRPPEDYLEKDRARIKECIELLRQEDIHVVEKEGIHQKFVVIDQQVIWYGSINLLGFGVSDESVMRIENTEIAAELLGIV